MLVSNPCCIGFCPEASGLINLPTFLTRSDAWPFFYANRSSIRHKPNASGLQARDLFTSLFDELEIKKFRYSIFSRVLLGVPRWVLISLNVNAPLVRGISGRANSDQPLVEANL